MNGLKIRSEKNQKLPWNEWKWKYNDTMGHIKVRLKRKINSITGLPQETVISQNKILNLYLK